jgi:hypothetical protein
MGSGPWCKQQVHPDMSVNFTHNVFWAWKNNGASGSLTGSR